MSQNAEIEELRNRIDNLDTEIIVKIAELIRISKRNETYREGLAPIESDDSFDEVIRDSIRRLAIEYDLNAEGIKRIFNAIKDLLSNEGREDP